MVLAHAEQTKALLSILILMKKPKTDEEEDPIAVTGKNVVPGTDMRRLIRGLLNNNQGQPPLNDGSFKGRSP